MDLNFESLSFASILDVTVNGNVSNEFGSLMTSLQFGERLTLNAILLTLEGACQEQLKKQLKELGYQRIKPTEPIVTSGDCCPICMEQYIAGTYKRTTKCGHVFHKKCIDKWFKKECPNYICPVCRCKEPI